MLPTIKDCEQSISVLEEILRTNLSAAAKAARQLGAIEPDLVATTGLTETLSDMADKFKPVKAGLANAQSVDQTIQLVLDRIRVLKEQQGLPFADGEGAHVAGEPSGKFVETDRDVPAGGAPPPPQTPAEPPPSRQGRKVKIVPRDGAAPPPAALMSQPSGPPAQVREVDLEGRDDEDDPPGAEPGTSDGGYQDV